LTKKLPNPPFYEVAVLIYILFGLTSVIPACAQYNRAHAYTYVSICSDLACVFRVRMPASIAIRN
jgi:hypothetical protein